MAGDLCGAPFSDEQRCRVYLLVGCWSFFLIKQNVAGEAAEVSGWMDEGIQGSRGMGSGGDLVVLADPIHPVLGLLDVARRQRLYSQPHRAVSR